MLGTGLFVGANITLYFCIGTIAWICGKFGDTFLSLLLEMGGGYTLWGTCLLAASDSYVAPTRAARWTRRR